MIPEAGTEVFSVHDKGKKHIVSDFDEENQGVFDFNHDTGKNSPR